MSLLERTRSGPRFFGATVKGDMLILSVASAADVRCEVRASLGDVRALRPFKSVVSDDELREVKLSPEGEVILFPVPDVDMRASTLLALLLGLQSPSTMNGRTEGVNTDAQKAASRLNGAKGGRPRKKPEGGK